MDDRELLELAAKAAGIVYHDDLGEWRHQDWCRYWADGDFCTCGGAWNPLNDDGDALRLAVKLRMIVEIDSYHAMANGNIEDLAGGADPFAATRRAIVRAAAEIARSR